LGFCRL